MPITHFPPPPTIKAPPLSYATRVGDLLFVSGIPGFDDSGKLAEGFEAQFGFVAAMNKLYATAFGPPPYPARTTCIIQALPDPAMLIEIECVASLAQT